MNTRLFDEDVILKYEKCFIILCHQEHIRSVLRLYKYLSEFLCRHIKTSIEDAKIKIKC